MPSPALYRQVMLRAIAKVAGAVSVKPILELFAPLQHCSPMLGDALHRSAMFSVIFDCGCDLRKSIPESSDSASSFAMLRTDRHSAAMYSRAMQSATKVAGAS